MKKKKSMIILVIYLLVCFIGVTFAWIDESAVPTGNQLVLEWGEESLHGRTLGIVSRNITFELQVLDEDTNEYVTTNDLTETLSKTGIVPNQPIYLKILLGNPSTEKQEIDIQFSKMSTNMPTVFQYLYFSINSATNYPSTVTSPAGTFCCFTDELTQSGSYYSTFVARDIIVPPTDEGVVELDCYILLSRLADSSYENMTFNIGIFRVLI